MGPVRLKAGSAPTHAWLDAAGGGHQVLPAKGHLSQPRRDGAEGSGRQRRIQARQERALGRQAFVTDPKGNKLALLRRDITFPAAHAKFTTFSYKPNFEGQDSTDVDADDVAIYPFAQLRCIVPSMPPKYEYLLFKTNDLLKPELNSTINSVCSSRKRGTMTDMKDQLMLRFEEFITGKEGAGYIDVEVAAGIDPLQA